ncbi:AraC-like DNA-binding protein [Paenibacillus phyllosphaerae]|uniref:AraC-like DNA-binding protein n=1 Tax=Paenibacillus phyllosphaerae TaxID=274593 RepID=A0A7W5B0K9_9BACL|nr:helix-turn-helix domain-containing protein [Paenibacillus phyllosphaerae]MBB3111909.1 AraC-like DNA-binding protein [Paenibacillus phyllosphaerae]
MTYPHHMEYGVPAGESVYVEYMRRDGPYSMDSNHWHPFYEIYYLIEGRRTYFIRDTAYSVEAGDLVLIRRHELHKTMQTGEGAHTRVIAHFDEQLLQSLPKPEYEWMTDALAHCQPVIRLPLAARGYVEGHIGRLMEELHSQPAGFMLVLRQTVLDLALLCARHAQSGGRTEAEASMSLTSPIHRKASEVARYLNDSFEQPVHLHELAARFYVSPYYLSRVFKEVTGFTIIDYVNLIRIKEAQRLLRETSLSVTDIAGQVGFGNFSHFGKMFKSITRMSARQYRSESSQKVR